MCEKDFISLLCDAVQLFMTLALVSFKKKMISSNDKKFCSPLIRILSNEVWEKRTKSISNIVYGGKKLNGKKMFRNVMGHVRNSPRDFARWFLYMIKSTEACYIFHVIPTTTLMLFIYSVFVLILDWRDAYHPIMLLFFCFCPFQWIYNISRQMILFMTLHIGTMIYSFSLSFF